MIRYMINKIDWNSFPEMCQPHLSEKDLPKDVYIEDVDSYRQDAAAGGLLVHSPYCPNCLTRQRV